MGTTLSYNGIAFEGPLLTVSHEQEPEVDPAGNYLWQLHTLHVEATLNVQTTAYAAPVNGAAPVATAGTLPATTEGAIRHQLSQSRGELVYAVGGINILRSPAVGAAVDAQNGPMTVGTPVVERIGNKTFKVKFVVQTRINEASLYVDTPTPVLSNAYRMRETINADFFSTRIIQGKIVCRSDRLSELQAYVDDYRNYLFPPIPNNFQRESIDITAAENNTEAEYVVVDRERALNIVAPQGVTRIEGTWTQQVTSIGAAEYSYRETLAQEGLNISGGIAGMNAYGNARTGGILSQGVVDSVASIGSFAVNAEIRLQEFRRGNAPRIIHTMTIRVWGNRNSNRLQLQAVALSIIQSRLAFLPNVVASTNATVGHDLMGKYVEATCVFQSGPLQIQAGVNGAIGPAVALTLFNFPQDDGIANFTTVAPAANPAPPGDGKSRGTYLGAIIAAALLSQNATPPTPPEPRLALNLQP